MTRWPIPLLSFALLGAAAPPQVRVVDGDTIVVGAETVRLWGVDAPEGRQTCRDRKGAAYACGDVARDRLRQLIKGVPVTCQQRDRDGYDRLVGLCRAGGHDLGEAMVRSGWAVEYRQFSSGSYARAESEARAARRGLWAGRFQAPSEWRAEQRALKAAPPRPPGQCTIKGNINAKGRRIFHAPGQQDYAATIISSGKGERWFCTAAEALAAGWKPAQR
jgi:endonuclease YncB( thermonuclease family)